MSTPPSSILDTRRSVPARQLSAPGPDAPTLLGMLRAAVRVPDHGKRVPFRFIHISGPTRQALGERLVERALERDPDASEAVIEKDRNRFNHAPDIIVVVARLVQDDTVPASERFSTASCVCFALLQAAQLHGFGAQWLTGWPAYDPAILRLLGLQADETVAGFIHVGTPGRDVPERERPDPAQLLTPLRL